ncbi:MurR/RpiR family transcriptional regulator [Enterococcus casseliflavus]|uniref:MurR/RpiR family transcriptional regulator n=1 Tax=Enterococcus casseliflavus TaxID=37734 RepID=UPI001C486FCA|nr:MurR/RpiR family transcriptional regulator [Enterococcus casseliflavus]MBV6373241.1 MurR/RpiR family transcriptional regulator [Enterococcus casseliflavus]
MKLQLDRLNELELEIHEKLIQESKNRSSLTITEAAELTDVSISKISKFVKKLGFNGYKEYARFLTGKELITRKKKNTEFNRISSFIGNFNYSNTNYIADLISSHEKIILFGYGPTHICMEYFDYKLTYLENKNIVCADQTSLIPNLLDENTLLLVFSVAGKFAQFDELFDVASDKNAKAVLIMEELNPGLSSSIGEIIYLTDSQQDISLRSHEKTRSILFIFIEEIIRTLSSRKKQS